MVGKDAIPESVVYTALGHLHKRQVVDGERNIIYSGSVLQNAFDESGYKKSVTVFDLTEKSVKNLKEVELEGYLKLERAAAQGYEEAMAVLAGLPDTYVELTLTLNEPLTSDLTKTLVTTYPKVIIRTKINAGEQTFESRKLMSDEQLFTSFYRAQYGVDPDKSLVELFLSLISEADEVEE